LVDKKRVDRALRIFSESGVAAAGFRLLVIGDGPQAPALRALAVSLGIADAIVWRSSVRSLLMPAYYSGATAIILASEYDQWGLCISEAMACGVPAMVSRRCGVAGEIVTDRTGIGFDGDDLNPAIEGLKRLVADPRYAKRLSTEAKRMMSAWDLNRFAMSAISLVDQLGTHTNKVGRSV